MKTVRVEVTAGLIAADVLDRTAGRCGSCPVALALLAATGDVWRVTSEGARRPRDGAYVSLPVGARYAVRALDRRLFRGRTEAVEPLSFEIEVPER
jgi:hypothetical protein